MEIEQLEIRDYLGQCPPFDMLDETSLDQVIHALEITYVRRNTELLKIGNLNKTLYLIRSGAFAVFDKDNVLQGQYAEGDWVGYRSLLNNGQIAMSVRAMEDSLIYCIPDTVFMQVINNYESIRQYFSNKKPARLRSAIKQIRDLQNNPLVSIAVRDLVHGQPLMVEASASIREVAAKMTTAGYTVSLVMQQDKLIGIVTDRAYCTKVAARELSLDTPVTEIMTHGPMTISADSLGSDALLMMARHNIRHLPVVEYNRVIGVVTATDLIRRQSHNTIYLINEIYRAKDTAE
ncbi:MAG: CBS domain-containing protein, partial [Gammaproteobacteria bacterium]|nr:CBS domain-containing protein [Gammaproteobacteria bacterium]